MVDGCTSDEEFLAEWAEQERNAKEPLRESLEVINNRNFLYLVNRVHTRESSTLIFSTVAVSASLLLLGILIQMENPLNIIPSLYSSSLNLSMLITIYFSYKFFLNTNNWLF